MRWCHFAQNASKSVQSQKQCCRDIRRHNTHTETLSFVRRDAHLPFDLCEHCLDHSWIFTTTAFRVVTQLYTIRCCTVASVRAHAAVCLYRWSTPAPLAQGHTCLSRGLFVMAPKRQKEAPAKSPTKKAKTASKAAANDSHQKLVQSLLEDKLLGQTYCEELGINLTSGSNAVFQWLACSSMFGSRLGEVRSQDYAAQTLPSILCTFCKCI